MNSHTSLSDHYNSVSRSASVIHSESLLNILAARSRSKLQTRPKKIIQVHILTDSDSSEEEQ